MPLVFTVVEAVGEEGQSPENRRVFWEHVLGGGEGIRHFVGVSCVHAKNSAVLGYEGKMQCSGMPSIERPFRVLMNHVLFGSVEGFCVSHVCLEALLVESGKVKFQFKKKKNSSKIL